MFRLRKRQLPDPQGRHLRRHLQHLPDQVQPAHVRDLRQLRRDLQHLPYLRDPLWYLQYLRHLQPPHPGMPVLMAAPIIVEPTSATRATGWRPVLRGVEAVAAIDTATTVARRVFDPQVRAAATARAAGQSGYPESIHWQPVDIAQGDAGLALLAGALDDIQPGAGWDAVAHRSLNAAADQAGRAVWSARLYGGLAGLAFAALRASHGGARYRRMLASLDAVIAEQVVPQAASLAAQTEGMSVSDFDVISGITGTGAYLLARTAQESAGPEVDVAVRGVLRALVTLTTPIGGRQRWRTPHDLIGDPTMIEAFPHGTLNCGLAHGIPGPLALMSLALTAGYEIPGLPESIERTAGWLLEHRVDDRWGPNWPTVLPTAPNGREDLAHRQQPGRAAWCYGAPGVARAVSLAGLALGDSRLVDLAAQAMLAVHDRPSPVRAIDGPGLCHGGAGLAQVTLRMAADTGREDLAAAAAAVARDLVAEFDPESMLGYSSLEPGDVRVEQPGLLEGATGVALTLLAAAAPADPGWDRILLLS